LYEVLHRLGAARPPQLAGEAGIAPRYCREWLEQQAAAGLLRVDQAAAPPEERVYSLPAAHAEVLTASDSLFSRVASILPLGGVAQALPQLLEAYRTGAGVPDGQFGSDWREGHAGANRALFAHFLPGWIERWLPGLHARMSSAELHLADVACGAGWAGLALARAYPHLRVMGIDIDPEIVRHAQRNAELAGLAGRCTYLVSDITDAERPGTFDVVCLFDALHEIPQPVPLLRACKTLRAGGGHALVLDAKVAEQFTAPANEIERFQYTTSVLHCLPACMCGANAAGTGTVMRPDTVRRYALEAGFSRVDELPIDDRFHRLYHLQG
jgi:SAM-dependent methyltransferase